MKKFAGSGRFMTSVVGTAGALGFRGPRLMGVGFSPFGSTHLSNFIRAFSSRRYSELAALRSARVIVDAGFDESIVDAGFDEPGTS
jgi:hypothetical protein